MTGVLDVVNSAGYSARFQIGGPLAATVEITDPSSKYSHTKDTGSVTNVYWDSGAARYILQNNSGGSLTYSLMLHGAYEGF
jgi:hypothetical protein